MTEAPLQSEQHRACDAAPLARAGVAGAQSLDVHSWPERVGEGAVDADPLEVRRLRLGAARQRSSPAIAGARWLQRSRSQQPRLRRLCSFSLFCHTVSFKIAVFSKK